MASESETLVLRGGAPTSPSERISSLDALRGLALFGVLAINLETAFRISLFQQFLPASPEGGVNGVIDAALNVFLEMKAFILFSLLFGVGLAIQHDRLVRNPLRGLLLVRRVLILLMFGLIHLVLIWNGDILTEYALAGLIVLPFLYGPTWLLITASVLCVLAYLAFPIPMALVGFPDQNQLAQQVRDAQTIYSSGGYEDVLRFRIEELPAILALEISVFPRTLALFFFGALTWRLGIYRANGGARRWLWSAAGVGIGVGLLLTVAKVDSQPLSWQVRTIGDVVLALGYWALVLAAMETKAGQRLLGWAEPIGRTAFTNYIMQSVVLGLIFYGYGLGLFNRLDSAQGLALVLAIFAAQAAMSALWLQHYRYGPLEWLWRTLTYGRAIAIRVGHR